MRYSSNRSSGGRHYPPLGEEQVKTLHRLAHFYETKNVFKSGALAQLGNWYMASFRLDTFWNGLKLNINSLNLHYPPHLLWYDMVEEDGLVKALIQILDPKMWEVQCHWLHWPHGFMGVKRIFLCLFFVFFIIPQSHGFAKGKWACKLVCRHWR